MYQAMYHHRLNMRMRAWTFFMLIVSGLLEAVKDGLSFMDLRFLYVGLLQYNPRKHYILH